MTDELHDAVTALTEPVITSVDLYGDDGEYLHTHYASHDPLLTQLDHAIRSSMNGHGGGGAAKNGRSVLNSDAHYVAQLIANEVGVWCQRAGVRAGRDTGANLTAWLGTSPEAGDYYTGKLREWERVITGMFNPRGRFQYAVACVACKAETYTDAEGVLHAWPLIATYAKDDPANTVTVTCRACDAEWERDGVGELIAEVESLT